MRSIFENTKGKVTLLEIAKTVAKAFIILFCLGLSSFEKDDPFEDGCTD